MKNNNDKWITVFGLSILILEQFVGGDGLELPSTKQALMIMILNLTTIMVLWFVNVWLIKITRKQYPGILQSGKRFLITGLRCIVVSYVLDLLSILMFQYVAPGNQRDFSFTSMLIYLSGISIILWMICGMYEAGYYQHLLRTAQREKNDLLNYQMQQQLDNLRNKVNPHFLFNSLNTLSSLLYSDANKAEQFVEELSTVYRYMLRNNESSLSTLDSELKFIELYMALLKTRFNEGLVTNVTAAEQLLQHKLPSLTLQILVDNAVQHNVISKQQPLTVSITTEEKTLVVYNNKQLKQQSVTLEKTGLTYVVSRYENLGRNDVAIIDTDAVFTVRIPLLEPLEEEADQLIINKEKNIVKDA